MTNMQIVVDAAITEGLYTEKEVEKLFSEFGMLPLFTFAEWKKKGYFVKKGEKAKLMCFIWKKKKQKEQTENDEEVNEREFFKTKAYFFTGEQVERVGA